MKSPIPKKEEVLSTRELMLSMNRRLASVAVASGVASILMAVAVISMMPLKEYVPYIIEVDRSTGEATVPNYKEASRFTPQQETIHFFIRRWVEDAFTINQYTTVQVHDPRARLFLRGDTAIAAYGEFLKQDKKFDILAENPTLVRDVQVLSITPVAGTKNSLVADVRLITRSGQETKEERRMVTVYYEIFPPQSRRDVENNPIGIYVTDFRISNVSNA